MESLGSEAWQLMWEVYKASRPYIETVMAEFDLTAMQGHALKALWQDHPIPMNRLADLMSCDASNITGIIDRLEARGYVMRRGADHDRRVKVLDVTTAGGELVERILKRMEQPPPAIANLSLADQRTLRDVLRRALDSLGPPPDDDLHAPARAFNRPLPRQLRVSR
jgi:DNA-binding MarR family transcriptional regulator